MMLMIRKMTERRTAIELVIWVLEGLTTVRSLRRMILEIAKRQSNLATDLELQTVQRVYLSCEELEIQKRRV